MSNEKVEQNFEFAWRGTEAKIAVQYNVKRVVTLIMTLFTHICFLLTITP